MGSDSEPSVVLFDQFRQYPVGVIHRAHVAQAQFDHQAILERLPKPLDPSPVQHFTTIIPTMKELEHLMFREIQEAFASAMKTALEMLDQIILEQRDRQRFRVKEERETSVNTVFGSIRFKRRLYWIVKPANTYTCSISTCNLRDEGKSARICLKRQLHLPQRGRPTGTAPGDWSNCLATRCSAMKPFGRS